MNYNIKDISADLSGKAIPLPTSKLTKGFEVYGHSGENGVFEADSLGGMKMADSLKARMSQTMNNFQKNIKFPDHPMKIGESFTQNMPFNLPMIGERSKLSGRNTYTLVSIADGKAYFDVKQEMNATIPIKGDVLTINGTGLGKMTYSIKDNFATDCTTVMTLTVNGELEKVQLDATAEFDINYAYTVIAN
jgi:hypothetical protein